MAITQILVRVKLKLKHLKMLKVVQNVLLVFTSEKKTFLGEYPKPTQHPSPLRGSNLSNIAVNKTTPLNIWRTLFKVQTWLIISHPEIQLPIDNNVFSTRNINEKIIC